MNIRLIRLHSKNLESRFIDDDNKYIEELNDALFDNDYVLLENPSTYLYSVLLVESNDITNEFKRIEDHLSHPTIILVGNCSAALKGALELQTYLSNNSNHSILANGTESENARLLIEVAKVITAKDKIDGSYLAYIGDKEDSLIDKASFKDIEKTYNVNFIKISKLEFLDLYDKQRNLSIPHENKLAKSISKSLLKKIRKLYNTFNDLVDKYNLKGISFHIDEFDELTTYVASLMNERGISFIVENDINSLMSLYILNSLNDSNAIYGDVVNINLEKNTISLLSNMVPFMMLDKNLEIAKSKVTLFKVGYDDKSLQPFILEGKVISSYYLDENDMAIEISLEEQDLFQFYSLPIGGSVAFAYGDNIGNLYAFNNIVKDRIRKNKKKNR